MKATLTTTDRATVLTVGHEDGRSATAAFASSLSATTSPLSSQAAGVVASLRTLTDQITGTDVRFRPDARTEALRDVAANMAPTVQAFMAAGQAEARTQAEAIVQQLGVEPGNAPLRAQVRDRFDAMDYAGQATFAQRASLEETSALLEAGRSYFADTPDVIWQTLEDQHIVQRHLSRTGLQADFQRKPDLSDVLATGPDKDAAIAAARSSLEAFRARSGILDDARAALASVIDAVALACDLDRASTFKMLTTK